MKREFLLLICVMRCFGVRLAPLENNDKLQDITNLYVAEWQWESWPIKQELSEQEGRSPGLRRNFALWGDSSKSAWYLFGGQPISGNPTKVYSDVWKFKVKTRVWKRFFPSQGEAKAAFGSKKGATTPGANVTEGTNVSSFEPITQGVVLCGGLRKKNTTKTKNPNEWSSFRRKKPEDDKTDELSSLAIYAPKTPKANTVWQIDVKEKIWTTYVCCCDSDKHRTQNSTKLLTNNIKTPNGTVGKNSQPNKNLTETKTNPEEDAKDNEQQHPNVKNKKKKINQIKKANEKHQLKKPIVEKRGNIRRERNVNEKTNEDVKNQTNEKTSDTKLHTNSTEKQKNSSDHEKQETKTSVTPKEDTKYCPEFTEASTPVTWCDRKNEALLTADISSSLITIWIFNLSTSHWFQLQIKTEDGTQWPSCPNSNSIRYVGNEEELYIICSKSEKQINRTKRTDNSPNPSEIPSDFNTKLVFRINYKEGVLQSLGEIRLNPYFNSPEGEKVWQNDSQSILQLIKNSDNDTILILAYLDAFDLWFLKKDEKDERFDLIEKIWRGSALKWFDKYNAPLYSLQFVSESGNLETILLPNPRIIGTNEYWPRERGRFIIRVFKNENLRNQSFENRTREQNLTYELLQSDYKPSESEHQLNHIYSLKVLVFFGISLTIFTVFGFVVFLKKCVTCPPKMRVRSECHKSPLIIRYSVIPDDLLYPVA